MEFVDFGVVGELDESGDECVSDEEIDLGIDWENLFSFWFCDIFFQFVEVFQSQSIQVFLFIVSSSVGGMIFFVVVLVIFWFKVYIGYC